jgi:hypothetical protein
MHIDLSNDPEAHRARRTAQAAIVALLDQDTDESNRIIGEIAIEGLETNNFALIGGYCGFTTMFVAVLLHIMEEDHGVDSRQLIQRLFLNFESY